MFIFCNCDTNDESFKFLVKSCFFDDTPNSISFPPRNSILISESFLRFQSALKHPYVNRETNELYHSLKKKADNDAYQMGFGLVLFWPLLFTLEGGDGPEATQYARLKGEHEAIRKVAFRKKCDVEFREFETPEDWAKKQERKSN